MRKIQATATSRCAAQQRGRGVALSLPVLPDGDASAETKIRPSKSGRRRAIILATVQLLMVVHVLHWRWSGTTLTPIEPSESVQTVRDGVINMGFIFFCVALLSTLVLGRWFCGWGCHIVMLQDLCGWLMKKIGIRPRPFKSRLLLYAPLLMALYMFVWPAVYRLGAWGAIELGLVGQGPPPWQASLHLTTTDFWRTFPGVMVAIPFLLTCGFATVYFLGAKGFCTYGCPYGGFFAPLDRYAVGRIRVTDACEQCGHCTAVCTSNVRVHEEVREYGMVVDPGCMKCLDCVSVCPNDALYFGFGTPAVKKGPARHKTPERKFDLGRREEFVLAGVFLLTFLAVLGAYRLVPFLMASGLAGVVTFVVWKASRLWRDANSSLHRIRLKNEGALTGYGWAFAALALLLTLGTAQCGIVKLLGAAAGRYAARVDLRPETVFAAASTNPSHAADRAIRLYRLASGWRYGGLALFHDPDFDLRLGLLNASRQRWGEAEQALRRTIALAGGNELVCRYLGRVLSAQGQDRAALDFYRLVIQREPGFTALFDDALAFCQRTRRPEEAVQLSRQLVEALPDSALALRRLGLSLFDAGRQEEGVPFLRRSIELDPSHPDPFSALAAHLAYNGRVDEAHELLTQALLLAPNDSRLLKGMGRLLQGMGRADEAQVNFDRAAALGNK